MKHALIAEHHDDYPLSVMCDALDLPRSGVYAAEQRRRQPLGPRALAAPNLLARRAGNCWDNAVAESFFATLKTELTPRVAWPTRAAAAHELAEIIDQWYNHERRHASLNCQTPIDYDRTLTRRLTA